MIHTFQDPGEEARLALSDRPPRSISEPFAPGSPHRMERTSARSDKTQRLSHTPRITRKPRLEIRTPLHLPWEFSERRITLQTKWLKKGTRQKGPATTGFPKQNLTQQPFWAPTFYPRERTQLHNSQASLGKQYKRPNNQQSLLHSLVRCHWNP